MHGVKVESRGVVGNRVGAAGPDDRFHSVTQTVSTTSRRGPGNGPKSLVAVGKFDNRSDYLRGIFSDNVDRLGGQAKTGRIRTQQP